MRIFPNAKHVKAKLLEEYQNKKILELSFKDIQLKDTTKRCVGNIISNGTVREEYFDFTTFPWPISDNTYDLIVCQNVLEHLPNTTKTLEELNRIANHNSKVFIETPHYTWLDTHRHYKHHHRFSYGSFDFFLKDNRYCQTDFVAAEKYLFFDDLTFLLGVGFIANLFPNLYEKRLAFIFPAISFHVTFHVNKD